MSSLEIKDLQKHFGGVRAVNGVSFQIESGNRLGIIGPNGAGKTTLLNLLTGQLKPTDGKILLNDDDITSLHDFERAEKNIARTFQQTNIYNGLTVHENTRLAIQQRMGITQSIFPISRYTNLKKSVDKLLTKHNLIEHANSQVANLAYGVRRHLELVLALALESSMLFLDEPTAGMTPNQTQKMIKLIDQIPEDIAICIVEHDLDVVFSLADRILVLHHGKIIAENDPENIKKNTRVQDVYLGKHLNT